LGDELRFAPELFELRANVIEHLAEQELFWFSHYSSVDCLHDIYGLEVCGIHERENAVKILRTLAKMFPTWIPRPLQVYDFGGERGWKAVIRRDAEPPRNRWRDA
jgi:hypothetical protein